MGGGGNNSATQNAMILQQMMMQRSQPITQLPQNLVPTAPPVTSPSDVTTQALANQGLLPQDLRVTSDNPVFGQDAATTYQNKYYEKAIMPLIERQRVQQFLGGRDNSTFGSTALASLAASGAKDAFFAGQDYRNQEIQNTLRRRDSLYGQEGRVAQEQNAADVSRSLGLNDQYTARLNGLNQANLGGLSTLSSLYNTNQNTAAAQARNRSNLYSGLTGVATGLASRYGGSLLGVATSLLGGSNRGYSPYALDPYSGIQASRLRY